MNRKGSAMVESVMVFPVIIITLTTLIYMMTYFYTQLSDRVDMHIALRSESGRLCGNMYYKDMEIRSFPVYKETQQIYSSHVTKSERNSFLTGQEKEINARKYLIDESKLVRMSSSVEEVITENKQ